MIISVNWLKQFTPIDTPIDELTELIGARLVAIEDVTDLSKKYKGVVVAKVIECEELKGSDHLNVTKIDDGGVVEDVERDENGWQYANHRHLCRERPLRRHRPCALGTPLWRRAEAP